MRSGDLQSVKDFLSKHKVDLNQVTRSVMVGVSPLMVACKNGYLEIAKLLLQEGADVNFENNLHHSALVKAAEGGSVEVVKLLLEHGASKGNKSALTVACEQGRIEVVEVLLPITEFNETGEVHMQSWRTP